MTDISNILTSIGYKNIKWGNLEYRKKKFDDSKCVISSRNWKDRQYNGQKKKVKNDLQNTT